MKLFQIPPLTLPAWNQIAASNSTSSLLSPIKNLLPATANPLNPRTSPYYSKRNLVIAPHPSELPLPSLSLTPKKNGSSVNSSSALNLADNQTITTNTMKHFNLVNSESDDNIIDNEGNSDYHGTSSMPCE